MEPPLLRTTHVAPYTAVRGNENIKFRNVNDAINNRYVNNSSRILCHTFVKFNVDVLLTVEMVVLKKLIVASSFVFGGTDVSLTLRT